MAEEIKALTSVIEKLVVEQERKRKSDEKANQKTEADAAKLQTEIVQLSSAADAAAHEAKAFQEKAAKERKKYGTFGLKEKLAADVAYQQASKGLADSLKIQQESVNKLAKSQEDLAKIRKDAEIRNKLEIETKATTQKMLKASEEDIKLRQGAVGHVAAQVASQEALKKSIEEQGGVAEDNKEFNKRAIQIEQQSLDLRSKSADTPAARKQIKQEQKKINEKQSGLLGKISAGVGGMFNNMKNAAKGAGKGLLTILKGALIGGLILAVIAFLNSEYWEETKKIIVDDVLPALQGFFEFLKDHWGKILIALGTVKAVLLAIGMVKMFMAMKTAFTVLKASIVRTILDPLKNSVFGQKVMELFTKMWTALKAGFIALKAKTMTHVLEPLKNAALGVGGKIWAFMKLIPPALTALKVFFMSTFLPAVTAFMVPLLPIIAIVAAISLALWALWSAFDDAKKIFEETGSIAEALKVGISKFMGTILGFIPAMILKLVGWVAGLFGFDDFKKKVDAIDPIQWISDTIKGLFDDIHKWFTGLFTWAAPALKEGWTNLTTFVSGVWTKVKTWFTNLFSWASTEDDKDSFVVKTIKKAVTAVKEWLGNLFKFDSASDIITSAFNVVYFLPNLILTGLRKVSTWLLSLFGFDQAAQDLANTDKWTIGSMIVGAFKAVKKWIVDLFTWGENAGVTASGDFSLIKMIKETITKIKDWFLGLLDIDIKAIMMKIPGVGKIMSLLPSWMGGGEEKPMSDEESRKIHGAKAAADQAFELQKKNDKELARREALATRRQKQIDEVEEKIAQQELWLKSGGKEGKHFQTGWASAKNEGDIQDQKELIQEDQEKLAKLKARNEKASEADTKWKTDSGQFAKMKERIDRSAELKRRNKEYAELRKVTEQDIKDANFINTGQGIPLKPHERVGAQSLANERARDARWADREHDRFLKDVAEGKTHRQVRAREKSAETAGGLDPTGGGEGGGEDQRTDLPTTARLWVPGLRKKLDLDAAGIKEHLDAGNFGQSGTPWRHEARRARNVLRSHQRTMAARLDNRAEKLKDIKIDKNVAEFEAAQSAAVNISAPQVSNSSKNVNVSQTTKRMGHPSATLEAVNKAA